MSTFGIKGLAELEKALEQFPDRVARNILAGAVRAGAVVIQKEARNKVKDSGQDHWLYSRRTEKMKRDGTHYKAILIKSGSLRKGIKVRLAPRKSRERPIEYWVYVSKKLWYWRFVEFGSSKMSAKSFMRPAFESEKKKAVEAIKEYLAARIDKEASKATS